MRSTRCEQASGLDEHAGHWIVQLGGGQAFGKAPRLTAGNEYLPIRQQGRRVGNGTVVGAPSRDEDAHHRVIDLGGRRCPCPTNDQDSSVRQARACRQTAMPDHRARGGTEIAAGGVEQLRCVAVPADDQDPATREQRGRMISSGLRHGPCESPRRRSSRHDWRRREENQCRADADLSQRAGRQSQLTYPRQLVCPLMMQVRCVKHGAPHGHDSRAARVTGSSRGNGT